MGIDDYTTAPLTGCVADAEAMASRLEKNSDASPNFHVKRLVSPGWIDRHALREGLDELFSNAQGADLVFYFSGHGGQSRTGAFLATCELDEVPMDHLLTLANQSPAVTTTIILDCCFSGDAGNNPGLQSAQIAEQFRKSIGVLAEGVTVLAASRASQVSMEMGGHGVFTRLLLDGLDGGATDHTGIVTPLSLYGYASPALGAWEQRPVFKSHVTEPPRLRLGPPWLDVQLLRDLPNHFAEQSSRVAMTPAHEGDGRPIPYGTGTTEQRQYDYFKRLRNAGLLATDDEEDLYFVAMHGREVYLTTLGMYFWRRANEGKV